MAESSESRPNIVFVFSDQQRWDTCGCYGQPLPITPNLDHMAAEGVRFDMAFTCQPVCGPARACLQTGKYATEIGCPTNNRMLPRSEKTIANWLSEAGYRTGYVGKWHLASQNAPGGPDDFTVTAVPPDRRGGYKDYWMAADILEFTSHSYDGHVFDGDMNRVDFPPGRYRADCVTDLAIDFLRSRDGRRPFFLFISCIEPHHQNDHGHFEGPHGSKEKFKDFVVPGDLAGAGGFWREEYPDYLGCCNSVDYNLGRVRAELERLGLADNTVVIYTSDHGCHFGTRNAEDKRSCHDASIRIPMVACGPGFSGGKVVDNLVSLIDLPPTLLSICGVKPPPYMRGRDLTPLVSGGPSDWLDEVFLQISESQDGRAIRTRRWKYSVAVPGVQYGEGMGNIENKPYVESFLYDLESDPHERNNLIGQASHRHVADELRERLRLRIMEAGEPEPTIIRASMR